MARVFPFYPCASMLALLAIGIGNAGAAGLRLELASFGPVYTGTQNSFALLMGKEDPADGLVHHGPFTAIVTLPEGMTILSTTGHWVCAPFAPGERTFTCMFNADLDGFNYNAGFLSFTTDAAYDLPLGVATLQATIESAEVPLPPDPDCTTNPSVTGCASMTVAVEQSKLEITDWGSNTGSVPHEPVAVWAGLPYEAGATGTLYVGVLDTGFGSSNTPVTLKLRLPPAVTYDGLLGGIPGWTCAAQLQPDGGDLVTCTAPSMYHGQYGFVSMQTTIGVELDVPGPVFFHAAVGNDVAAPPENCEADPAQLGCGRLQMPTFARCAVQFGADGIYCDGFEIHP